MMLQGSRILVTGGGSGIGRGIAEALHRRGNHVVIAGRRTHLLESVARANPGMDYLSLDQADPVAIANFAAELARRFPDLNVLVNNAGVQRPERLTVGDTDAAELQITINLLGPIRLTAALMPQLAAQPRAAIVNVSSGLAFVPNARLATYSATKAALHSYTQSLRQQLRDSEIDVIEIIPPQVRTALRDGDDPRAMPLTEYLDEILAQLIEGIEPEVLVSRVRPLRFAERDGAYDEVYRAINAEADPMRDGGAR